MLELGGLGKLFITFGLVMIVLGGILLLVGNITGKVQWIGRLPGDIYIQRGNWSFYFPLATSLLLSIILTLILSFLGRR
jgi:predicted phosphohydrolase